MKKITAWVAAGLMFLGVALFLGVGIYTKFDLTRLDSVKYITNTYEISEQFHSIDIDTVTVDIEIKPSADGKCRVICYESEKLCHQVLVRDGILEISSIDSRSWLDQITIISFETPRVILYLPEGTYQSLQVENTTGNVTLAGHWELEQLSLETTTGDMDVSGLECKKDVSAKATTGNITMQEITCSNFSASGTTGDTVLQSVMVSGTMRLNRTTGDIKLENCDASEVYIKATTGDVTGSFLTPKVINAKSTTGKVDVPQHTAGGPCQIQVTTGDICIEIP